MRINLKVTSGSFPFCLASIGGCWERGRFAEYRVTMKLLFGIDILSKEDESEETAETSL